MNREPTTIDADDAAELYETTDGGSHNGWTRVADQKLKSGRWMENHYLVVTKGDGFFGVPYAVGLTEEQEHELPWEDQPDKPIKMVPLVAEQVTKTVYRRVKP